MFRCDGNAASLQRRPSLRLSTPPGYTTVDAASESDPSHGSIVLFHRSQLTRTMIDLPQLLIFEALCGESVTFLAVYRPGSARATSLFFDDLTSAGVPRAHERTCNRRW